MGQIGIAVDQANGHTLLHELLGDALAPWSPAERLGYEQNNDRPQVSSL